MTDPLLAALIAKLPPSGADWPIERRAAWLKMLWMAFDVVYGAGDGSIEMPAFLSTKSEEAAPVATATSNPAAPVATKPDLPLFYIDVRGHARRRTGEPVMPGHVTETLFDQRGESGDLAAIVWADGSRGVRGLQLDIAAA